jgi:hypothetical protein
MICRVIALTLYTKSLPAHNPCHGGAGIERTCLLALSPTLAAALVIDAKNFAAFS